MQCFRLSLPEQVRWKQWRKVAARCLCRSHVSLAPTRARRSHSRCVTTRARATRVTGRHLRFSRCWIYFDDRLHWVARRRPTGRHYTINVVTSCCDAITSYTLPDLAHCNDSITHLCLCFFPAKLHLHSLTPSFPHFFRLWQNQSIKAFSATLV